MEIARIVEEIDALKREIDALRPLDPDTERRIMQKFRLDWNFHSNSIEGNTLTYGETKTFLKYGITANGKPLKDHLEIKGHNEVLQSLEEMIKDERPLTEHQIRELHVAIMGESYEKDVQTPDGQMVKREVKAGQYKTTPNHVITVTGEIHHYASPEETPAKMHDLMTWYREAIEDQSFHPLLVAALFHHKFVAIHPFDDGNGRLSRILMNLILMKAGYPPAVIKTEKKEAYYRALHQADGGDQTAFIAYIGEELRHSLELYLKGARGENIEDYNDIDKQIALLKAELNGEKEKVVLDRERFLKVYKEVVRPLLVRVLEKLEQFDELFFEKKIIFWIKNAGNIFTKYEDILKWLDTFLESNKDIDNDFKVEYSLNEFKKTDFAFSIKIKILILFKPYDYFLISSEPESFHEVKISYTASSLSEDDTMLIINELVKNMLAQIQAGMKQS